jgi:hypothetical protein
MKTFSQFISEAASARNMLFHGTNIKAAVSIIKSGELHSSSNQNTWTVIPPQIEFPAHAVEVAYHEDGAWKARTISFTRSYQRAADFPVILEFSRDRIANRYKLEPIRNSAVFDKYDLPDHFHEFEEMIFAKKISVGAALTGIWIREFRGKDTKDVGYLRADPRFKGTFATSGMYTFPKFKHV